MKSLKLVTAVAAGLFALSSQAANGDWRTNVADGWYTNAANWVGNVVPTASDRNVRFYYETNTATTNYVRFTELDTQAPQILFNVKGTNTVTVDGADAVFRQVGGVARTGKNPLSIQTTGQVLNLTTTAESTDADVLSWSNVLFQVFNDGGFHHGARFLRGLYDYTLSKDSGATHKVFLSNGQSLPVLDVSFSNVTVRAAEFTHSAYAFTNLTKIVDSQFDVLGINFATTSKDYNHTNDVVIANSTLNVGKPELDTSYVAIGLGASVKAGYDRPVSIRVTDGSRVASTAGNRMTLRGEVGMTVDNKTVFVAPADVRIASDSAKAGATCVLTVSDAEFSVQTNASGIANIDLGRSAGVKGVLNVVNGGWVHGVTALDRLQMNVGNGGVGEVNLVDGKLDHSSTASMMVIGRGSPGTLNVSGGQLTLPSYLSLGFAPPSGYTAYTGTVRQTGGYIKANHINVTQNSHNGVTGLLVLDGGESEVKGVYGNSSVSAGKLAHALFRANGGKLIARENRKTAADAFIRTLDEARLGARGLTIDGGTYTLYLAQDFTDLPGEKGVLRLTGTGSFVICAKQSGATAQSYLDVAAATTFDEAVSSYAATVVVTNGQSLSFADRISALSLGGLRLGDDDLLAHLTLKTTSSLTLGALDLRAFDLTLADAHVAGTYPVINVRGRLSNAVRTAWQTASVVGGRMSGLGYSLEVGEYDEANDRTVLSVLAFAQEAPSVENGWRGDGSAKWSDAGNWARADQGKEVIATFDSAEAAVGVSVDVDRASIVGAVAFTVDRDYTLAGEWPLILADTGSATLTVLAGHQRILTPLFALGSAAVAVSVADGASLTLGKVTANGGLTKSGAGLLTLSGAGTRSGAAISAAGGVLAIASPDVFAPADADIPLELVRDTLVIGGDPSAPEVEMPLDLHVATAEATDAVVISNAANVAMAVRKSACVSSGAIVKRGEGRLALTLGDAYSVLSVADGKASSTTLPSMPATALEFPANGAAPTDGYAGFNVVEGTVELRGTAPEKDPRAEWRQYFSYASGSHPQWMVGLPTTAALTAGPAVDVNHARVPVTVLHLGSCAYADGDYPDVSTNISLMVRNRALMTVNTLYAGYYVYDRSQTRPLKGLQIDIAVSNEAILAVASQSWLPYRGGANVRMRLSDGSVFDAGGVAKWQWGGPLDLVAERGSWISRSFNESTATATNSPADLQISTVDARGRLTFRSRSVFHCKSFDYNSAPRYMSGNTITFAFDDGVWNAGVADMDFVFKNAASFFLEAQAGGLELPVPAAGTWRLCHPVTGVGGVVKTGAGTLRVEMPTMLDSNGERVARTDVSRIFACTGTNRVEAGTLVATAGADGARIDVASGAALQADGTVTGLVVSGAGMLTGGTFAALTIVHQDGVVPTLDGVTAEGTVKVDLGHDAEHPIAALPQNVKVAELGAAPSAIPRWRLVGTGLRNVRGVFRAEGNAVYMDAVETGLTVIVR